MLHRSLGILTDSLANVAMQSSNTAQSPVCKEPPDDIHFPVGVELAHEDLGDRTSTKYASSSSPTFLRGIMHKDVNPRSFVAHVQYDASAAAIAAVVGAPEQDVENLWLAGVRTPAKAAIDRRTLASKRHSMRFTPQSVLDCQIISGEAQEVPASEAEEACKETGLDRGQFADLFHEETQVDQQCLEFGNALKGRLEALVDTSRAVPRYQPPARRRSSRSPSQNANSAGTMSSKVEGQERRNADGGGTCGFSRQGSHVNLDIRCDGFAICKQGNGLYRTARSKAELRPPKSNEGGQSFYFEVVIVDDKDSGGICIGVATESLQLNKLVGSNSDSCGLHSSGQIVSNNGEFRQFGKSFKKGDRVGCLISFVSSVRSEDARTVPNSINGSYCGSSDGLEASIGARDVDLKLTFYVNGEKQGSVRETLWRGVPEDERKLFPVVSLYKKDSKAVLQCCKKDWVMKPHEVDGNDKAICCNCA